MTADKKDIEALGQVAHSPADVVALSASTDDGAVIVDETIGTVLQQVTTKSKGQPLPENDEKKEAEEAKASTPAASFTDLFVYADVWDILMLIVGGLCAGLAGAAIPSMGVLMGHTMDAFYPVYNENKVRNASLAFVGLAFGIFFTTALAHSLYGWTAARQVRKIRARALEHSLLQEMGWFDTTKPNELASRIAGDTVVIEQGMSQKLSDTIMLLCQFLSGYIIGFTQGWKLTFVMMASLPLLVVAFVFLGTHLKRAMFMTQANYAKAGGVAEEAFSSMRTVAALRAEKTLTERFADLVKEAEKTGLSAGYALGISACAIMFLLFASNGLGWWFGGWLIVYGDDSQTQTVGDVTMVFFSVMMGSMALGQVAPNMSAILEARGAMASIMHVLRRTPLIGADLEEGLEPNSVTGNITFRDVHFTYPSRKAAPILKGFTLDIKAGQTVALVGPSGSGKSTCIQLLQRFYDADSGSVELDGDDVRSLKLRWLREQMGLVSQEPVLFQGTIAENIAWGAGGLEKITMDEVIEAAKKANAHRFIMQFPDGYDTVCGEKGAMLSGGQKQRVAIARAIVRKPNLVLLDEATSALDTESERIVQEALDELMRNKQCTCIVVAHRLSTIRNADLIVAFKDGVVAEQGTHEELIARDGVYAQLVRIQNSAAAAEDKEKMEKESKEVAEFEHQVLEELIHRTSSRAHSTTRISTNQYGAGTSTVSVHSMGARASAVFDKASNMLVEIGLKEEGHGPHGDAETGEAKELKGWKLQKRVFELNKPVRHIFVLAIFCATINGTVWPLNALLLTDMMQAMGTLTYDPPAMYREVCKYALGYLGFAVAAGLAVMSQTFCYKTLGEKITTQLRVSTFANTVRQDIAFFDDEKNNTGALTARLATDAALVKAVAGENQGRQWQNLSTLVTSLLIAFILGSWKITLVMMSTFPLLVIVSMLQMRFVGMGVQKSQESVAGAGKLATEAISNVRTVKAYGLEESVYGRYFAALHECTREGIRKGIFGGLAAGATQLIAFCTFALVFWYGGELVGAGEITFDQGMKSLMAIMMAAQGLAQQTAFMGDTHAAFDAARKIFSVEDRKPTIDSTSVNGQMPKSAVGEIEVQDVMFKYPSRPNQIVLDGYNLKIKAGQTVALVGESGSGKSTIISLVERYYDPLKGRVLLDGNDLRSLNLCWLRDQIGLVGQEPVLFTGTIADNIRMAKPNATMDEIIEAAKMANAHNFIEGFPGGYGTQVGDRGVQLSGGQKQRIAIARAIIKNPTILLLDEATSALDAESERVVQEALDRLLAIKRRTTLVVAHRLSTIQNADLIAVHKSGKVVELGRHEELLALNGEYAKLNRLQVRL